MFRFGFLFFILFLSSNVFTQPNNGVAFINNLPNMTVGETYEIIIDGNGGGQFDCATDNIEGTYNSDIERWVFINNNWLFAGSTMNNGLLTFIPGDKMIARALSDIGSNSCASSSGIDNIIGEDGQGNFVDKNVCVYSGTLPVIWQSPTTVIIKNGESHITFSVATQLNNEKYIIEHSHPESFRDGSNFSPIGEIAGDGTSNETKHYEYIHSSPTIGINYYRIKQVDYNGKYSYSDIVSVRYEGDSNINIYPNPTTSEVTINVPSATTLRIMDVYGKLYTHEAISEGQNTINLSELPSGILIFAVGDQRFKVLKE